VFSAALPSSSKRGASPRPRNTRGTDSGFQVRNHESFEVSLVLSSGFYLDYMMTETNVASAVRNGVPEHEIRSWCEDTLGPLWGGREREVVFRSYLACMIPR